MSMTAGGFEVGVFLGFATSRKHARVGTYVLRRAYSKDKFSDSNAGTVQ